MVKRALHQERLINVICFNCISTEKFYQSFLTTGPAGPVNHAILIQMYLYCELYISAPHLTNNATGAFVFVSKKYERID